jgi:hypothetical protein
MAAADLYEADAVAWAEMQAEALRRAADAGSNLPLDFEQLAQDVEELADRRRDALEAALMRIVEHLLKLEHSPVDHPRRPWLISIAEHRVRALSLIESSDRLRQQLPSILPRAWRNARKLAAKGLAIDGIDTRDLPTHPALHARPAARRQLAAAINGPGGSGIASSPGQRRSTYGVLEFLT